MGNRRNVFEIKGETGQESELKGKLILKQQNRMEGRRYTREGNNNDK